MASVLKNFNLAVMACAIAASLGCFSLRQGRRTSEAEPCDDKAFCEVAQFCAYAQQGTPASHFIGVADEASRSIRTIKADVSVIEKLHEPTSQGHCRVTTQRNTVQWTLDFEKRRYHLKRLDGDGTYVEGACGTDTCAVLRRVQQGKILFSATIAKSSEQDIRDSVVEEETTVWWLEFLNLHREVALASIPNLGERRLSVWYGNAPEAASAAEVEIVAETNLPLFGACQVVRIVFKQPELRRDVEMWVWLASQNGLHAVRSAIYAKSTGGLVIREVLRGFRYAGVYLPIHMREAVYYTSPSQQNVPLSDRRAHLAILREIKLDRVTVNTPLDESVFEFEIPKGTLIEDRLRGKVYVHQVTRPAWLPMAVVVVAVLVTLYIFGHLRQLLVKSRSD